jgi:ATP-dependent Clp protease ATP-binding subunit ClpA
MIMFQRYTENARRAIFFSRREAGRLGSHEIRCLHVLLGILNESGTTFLAAGLSGTVQELAEDLRRALPEPGEPIPDHVDLPLSNESKKALLAAAAEAERSGSRDIKPIHLVLGLTQECQDLATILAKHGIEHANMIKLAQESSG